jgi:hypothetical protein
MSKISIAGAATGAATFTIESPATSTNRTLTLPDNTGTIVTQNSTPAFASTIGVGGATPSTSGAGITFPAAQSASSNANTLDDYEEGTWTPTYTASTTNPTVTYARQDGYYTKIGDIVFVYFMLGTSAVTGGSGSVRVSGLPFSVNNAGTFPIYGNIVGENINWSSNAPTAVIVNPQSIPATSLSLGVTTVADMNTGAGDNNRLRASLVYRAA